MTPTPPQVEQTERAVSTDSNTTMPALNPLVTYVSDALHALMTAAANEDGTEDTFHAALHAAQRYADERTAALQREVEELRARMPNALRYEWLRGRYLRVFVADCHGSPVIDIECDDIEPVSESDGRRLDAAIDAASKAEVPNG